MYFSQEEVYELQVFDLRIPGEAERFERERDAWGEDAKVEILDCHHRVLLVLPGGARRLLR